MSSHQGETDTSRPLERSPISFVVEQQVGLQVFYRNLRQFIDDDVRIAPAWTEVTYRDPHGWIERSRLVPNPLRGPVRGTLQVRRALKQAPTSTRFFLTQVPAVLGGRRTRTAPFAIMADDTPILLDEMAHAYGGGRSRLKLVERLKFTINQRTFRRAAVIFPLTQWAADSFIRDYGVDPTRVEVLAPGVDLERWRPAERRRNAVPRLLFVGNDFRRKGGDVLLQAFAGLQAGSAELHLVGDIELSAPPQGVVVHRGLQPNGEELIRLFQQSDVFVLPSRAEAFGQVIVEAQAVGLPAIVTAVGGMPDVIEDGVTGHVIPPDDAAALEELLRRLVTDASERERLSAAARTRAEQLFDGRRNAARVVDRLLALSAPR